MAKQDFVNGGFRGKLGNLIGQRWLSLYTVKSYAKPRQPRTGKQQANRELFANATELANIANQYNVGAPMWVKENTLPFNNRVSQARTYLKNGITGENAIPLYRQSATPSKLIDDLTLEESPTEYTLTSVKWQLLSDTRHFAISAILYDTEEHVMVRFIYQVTNTVGSDVILTIPKTGRYQYSGNTSFLGITNDDSNFQNTFVYVPSQSPQSASVISISDAVVSKDTDYNVTLSSQSFSSLAYAYIVNVQYEVINGITGIKSTKTTQATSTAGSPLSVSLPLNQYETMSTGCKVLAYTTPQTTGAEIVRINTVTASLGVKTCSPTNAIKVTSEYDETNDLTVLKFFTDIIPVDIESVAFPSTFPFAPRTSATKTYTEMSPTNVTQENELDGFKLSFRSTWQTFNWLPNTFADYVQVQNPYLILRLALANQDATYISTLTVPGSLRWSGQNGANYDKIAIEFDTSQDATFVQEIEIPLLNLYSLAETSQRWSFSGKSYSSNVLTLTGDRPEDYALDKSKMPTIIDKKTSTTGTIYIFRNVAGASASIFEFEQEGDLMTITGTVSKSNKKVSLTIAEGSIKPYSATEIKDAYDDTMTSLVISNGGVSCNVVPISSSLSGSILNGSGSAEWNFTASTSNLVIGTVYSAETILYFLCKKNDVLQWDNRILLTLNLTCVA